MKRYFIDQHGKVRESASEAWLMHSTGLWDKNKVQYVQKVKTPAGNVAYLYPDDLKPGKKYGSKNGNSKEVQDTIDDAAEAGYTEEDLQQTIYGNINVANRQFLQNEDGSYSTILGTSAEYEGITVAYSPLLQTSSGKPQLLDDNTVDEYIYALMDKVGKDPKKLIEADKNGIQWDDKTHIHGLIADAGSGKDVERVKKTGEKMHYAGQYWDAKNAEFKQSEKKSSGKYAVISGGKHHKVDSYEEAMKFTKK